MKYSFLEGVGSICRIAVNIHLLRIKIHCVQKITLDIIIIYRVKYSFKVLISHLMNEWDVISMF